MKDNHKADVSHTDEFDRMYQEMVKQAEDKYKVKSEHPKTEEEIGLVDNFSSRWVNEFELPNGYIFKDENGNIINATKIVLEKKKKEYNKGTKVRHKTKGMVETIVGVCKIKYMGAWVDGVIYEGNDTNTGEPMTFVRVKEDFENNFEVC